MIATSWSADSLTKDGSRNMPQPSTQTDSNTSVLHYAGGPRRPPPPQLQLRRSRDLAHASIPLAQTPWGLTGRAWLQAGAQHAVIAIDPSFNSLGIDSRNAQRAVAPASPSSPRAAVTSPFSQRSSAPRMLPSHQEPCFPRAAALTSSPSQIAAQSNQTDWHSG